MNTFEIFIHNKTSYYVTGPIHYPYTALAFIAGKYNPSQKLPIFKQVLYLKIMYMSFNKWATNQKKKK